MADTSDNQQPQTPQTVIVQDPVIAAQQAIAAAAREAETKHLDESLDYPATPNADGTIRAGGRYKVNGVWVDANGVPHKNQKDT